MESSYNTQLSPEEEKAFQAWAQQMGKMKDLFDYDLRGAFKANGGQIDANGHMPDTFKKPNHPTFSSESQYHGKEGLQGGTWTPLSDGKFSFAPGATNLQNYSPQELQKYFDQYEPGNLLMFQPGE